jgi:hypothetical protein
MDLKDTNVYRTLAVGFAYRGHIVSEYSQVVEIYRCHLFDREWHTEIGANVIQRVRWRESQIKKKKLTTAKAAFAERRISRC